MINSEDFINRLSKILTYYQLSASSFADKIEVQRSSISHLLSGRNKPSLDFILKVTTAFPEVDLYWFLKGNGTFPKTENHTTNHTSIPQKKEPKQPLKKNKEQKAIEKIVVFYTDGSFKLYKDISEF